LSRNLNIGAVLLFIYGIWGVFEGLMSSLMGEWYLENWMAMMNEEFLPPTISEISVFSPELLDFMLFVTQTYGLFVLFGSLLKMCLVRDAGHRRHRLRRNDLHDRIHDLARYSQHNNDHTLDSWVSSSRQRNPQQAFIKRKCFAEL